MKRDFNQIRDILIAIEDQQADGQPLMQLLIDTPSNESFFYHLNLLFDYGLIDGENLSSAGAFCITGITWRGHDFLDATRSKAIWKKVLDKLAAVGGAATLEITVELAKQQIKESLGLKE